MILTLCVIVAFVVLARMSWPKESCVPRATVTGIIGGALARIIAFFLVLGVVLVLLGR